MRKTMIKELTTQELITLASDLTTKTFKKWLLQSRLLKRLKKTKEARVA